MLDMTECSLAAASAHLYRTLLAIQTLCTVRSKSAAIDAQLELTELAASLERSTT